MEAAAPGGGAACECGDNVREWPEALQFPWVGGGYCAAVPAPVVAVHGGAGAASRASLGEQTTDRRLTTVRRALRAAGHVLGGGGAALDAVCAAVVVFEEDGGFDAGRGAVRTAGGGVELDAAVMVGASRAAGAVAGVTRFRNPVLAARRVMEDGRHVLLVGPGADRFALEAGCETVDDEWFSEEPGLAPGTVGAVALDSRGGLAAATSTGGTTGQLDGRVGDSPLIGAGTWADDRTCAVSATGWGEQFIRAGFAHAIHSHLLYGSGSLAEACDVALADVKSMGGNGGCVAVSRTGEVALRFNSAAMFRGVLRPGAEPEVALD